MRLFPGNHPNKLHLIFSSGIVYNVISANKTLYRPTSHNHKNVAWMILEYLSSYKQSYLVFLDCRKFHFVPDILNSLLC